MTGFFRDGYCRVGPEDGGNHAVAGTLSSLPSYQVPFMSLFFPFFISKKEALLLAAPGGVFFGLRMLTFSFSRATTIGLLTREFLDFSASRGNNLRSIGLKPGCKWCLCTARWKEAADARKGDDDPVVPK